MAEIFHSNDHVVVEILLRLPAKSLTRFKLVCKHWLSLISAQQFCHLHTLRHPKPHPSLIFRTHTSHFFYFNPVFNNHKLKPYSCSIPNSKILNSCSLLLLLLQSVHPVEYHVYNSTTKQSRKIGLTDSDDFTKVMGLTYGSNGSKLLFWNTLMLEFHGVGMGELQLLIASSKSQIVISTISS